MSKKIEDAGWRKVRAPKPWKPEVGGEVLEGFYVGPKTSEGAYGVYVKHIIVTEKSQDPFFVSGTVIDTLFATSLAQPGMKVRVVFLKNIETSNGHGSYRDFDLYVKEPNT